MIYSPKENVICPHCGKSMDEKAEDLVIAGRVGRASLAVEECGWCEGQVECVKLPDGTINVEKE
jgi:hypothetical protein